MAEKPRRVDFNPDNFIAGVAGQLTATEIGVYWLICSLIYSRRGPIRNDPHWIAQICRDTDPRTVRAAITRLEKVAKVSLDGAEMLPNGERVGGEMMANGCRDELELALNRVRKAAENGSKGGRPSRKNKEIAKPGGLPVGFRGEKLARDTFTFTFT